MAVTLSNRQVIARRCFRCDRRPGHATWAICADGNKRRIVCWPCDRALNRLVLRWMRDPQWRTKCQRYEARHSW